MGERVCRPSPSASVQPGGSIIYGFRCAACNKPSFGHTKDETKRDEAMKRHASRFASH